jgi:small GTP-binding protein
MRLIETDCKVCGKSVSFEVEEKPRDHYPFSFIYYHGKPVHALISYIDKNYAIRSCQVIQEFGGQVTAPSEKITKKCIVVGDWGVGKTSFIQRIVKDCFDEDYDPTVTQCRSSCIFVLPNKRSLDIEFWDAAGQHEYFHNDPEWWSFVSGADAVIIMGDVTKPDSFKIMEGILQDVKKLARKNAIILGIANKTDRAKERKVKATDLDKFEDQYEIPIFELSVKEKNNLDELINRLIVDLGKE